VVASIFVNPLQFGENEDLDAYPRTLDADQQKLSSNGCDYLFAPSVGEMYSGGESCQTQVSVPELSQLHCGASRPIHFQGVATVVTKLFNIVQPDVAIFGIKDFQQLAVIKRITADLSLPVEIVAAPIARAPSGLALSSRNGYLTPKELEIAPLLYQSLCSAREMLLQGILEHRKIEDEVSAQLEANGFRRDYVSICRQSDLQPAGPEDKELVILAAAYLGKPRLIDNICLSLD
jgi:pantoate--beta-alanine ligase